VRLTASCSQVAASSWETSAKQLQSVPPYSRPIPEQTDMSSTKQLPARQLHHCLRFAAEPRPLWCMPMPAPLPGLLVPPKTATNTLRIPKVFHVGPMPNGRGSFIVMESLKMGGGCNMAELGKQLALMHLAEPAVSAVGLAHAAQQGNGIAWGSSEHAPWWCGCQQRRRLQVHALPDSML
jgi:hypothetical protein